jgi:hypothetical protein
MDPTNGQVDTQSKRMTFPSLRKDFRQQRIHNTSKELLDVEQPLSCHQINKVKSVNFPKDSQHDIFHTNRMTHPRWDLISR